MRGIVRLGFLLLLIGGSLVVVSYSGWARHAYGPPEPLESSAYFGYAFGSAGVFSVEAVDGFNASAPFSLYLLTIEDTLILLEEQSVENTTPLIEEHGIAYFNEIVNEYPPGKYGIVAIPDGGRENFVIMIVTVLHPYPGILQLGLGLISGGSIFITISILYSRAATSKSG